MGRWGFKTEAEDCKKVSIFWLKKHEYLIGFKSGSIVWAYPSGDKSSIGFEVSVYGTDKHIRFRYWQKDFYDSEKKHFDYKFQITTTGCHYGGVRYWFICGLFKGGVYCGRRVGVLYKDGDYFGCRLCYDLTYQARKVSKHYRYGAFAALSLDWTIEELEAKVKRPFYAGKPTRKQRRINKLYRKMGRYV